MALTELTIAEAAARIQTRELSPVELTRAFLERIERLNPALNAYITAAPEQALRDAAAAESEIGRGHYRGVLHGIPLALKDCIETAGLRTTAGSPLLREYIPAHDSWLAAQIKRAGAVLLGKTNMHEWGFGVLNTNPTYGDTRSPWDTARITAGSSGGNAAALAAGLCMGAFGTDARGSVRIPAALCGLVGLKPTYGSLRADGIIQLSPTLDHLGSMARDVTDSVILYRAAASEAPVSTQSLLSLVGASTSLEGRRIGVASDSFYRSVDPEVQAALDSAAAVVGGLRAALVAVDLGFLRETWELSRIISSVEAAYRHAEQFAAHPDGFSADIRARLEEGLGYSGVQYVHARSHQERVRGRMGDLMRDLDALLLPVVPVTAPRHDDPEGLADARRRFSAFNAPFNMTGQPAISVPCGISSQGMPIGAQFVGKHGMETELVGLAYAYEQATGWQQPLQMLQARL